jgi:hypothetical protein
LILKISLVPILKNDDVNNCCTISAIHVPSNDNVFTNEHTLEDSYSIAYDDYKDEYDIFSPPTIEDKTRICLLFLMIMVIRIGISIFVPSGP